MPVFEVTAPNGKTFEVNAPDGATREQALEYAKTEFAKTQQRPDATITDRVNAGITGLNRGIAGVLGLPMDTAQNVLNLGRAAAGTVANAAGRPDLAPDIRTGNVGTSEWIAKQLKKLNINTANPRPDDQMSRMLHTGGSVAGGSMLPGIRPGAVVPAAAGAAVAGEVSDNPLAPALGSMLPGAVRQGINEVRTNTAATVNANRARYQETGTQPSVAQATQSGFMQGIENLLSRLPGGRGIFAKVAEKQQADLAANTRNGVSAEDAGRAIETGVRGAGGFLDRTKATWNKLDAELSAKMPKDAGIAPTNSLKILDELTTPAVGAENVTGGLINQKLAQIKADIQKDISGNPVNGLPTRQTGSITYEGLRALRTQIGSMLDDSLVSGIPNAQLKRVYGALSKDMEAAAISAGAGREFARQNKYYSARMDRIESVLDRVIGKGKQPEDIFGSVNPSNVDQANSLRAVMRSLRPDERATVTDAVINRLGRSTPGKQNDMGDAFSSETFLTNWNRISPEAKAQLFTDSAQRRNITALAAVADDIRSGSKVFANPSGTAGAAAPYGLAGLAVTGNVLPAAGLIAGSYIGSRMLTSPKVVDWLANAPKVKPENAAAYLGRLAVIASETKDDKLRGELTQYVNSLNDKAK